MATPLARGSCPDCGTVLVHPTAVHCAVALDHGRQEGLCQFDCPVCGRVLLRRLDPQTISSLWRQGASTLVTAPFELLETHTGPRVGYDDVLDLHQALSHTCCPQGELLDGAATSAG